LFLQICHNIKSQGWQVTRDNAEVERMGPYATQGLQWVGFDDSKTIRQKSEFVKDQGFGGAMIW
jgi:chitinase